MALMVAYHFCFDLNYFGLTHFDFYRDGFWLGSRALIVSLFLLLVGVSLHLAGAGGLRRGAYARRLGILAVCAGMVSAASYRMFPDSGIFFGVLHFIAMAGVLGLLFVRFYLTNLVLGIILVIAGNFWQHAWFDHPWANWIGFMTHKPVTEDYVPLFPWFGVVLLGLFLGRWLLAGQRGKPLARWRFKGRIGQGLTWAGRHSLAIYMLHQPLLLALLYLVKYLG